MSYTTIDIINFLRLQPFKQIFSRTPAYNSNKFKYYTMPGVWNTIWKRSLKLVLKGVFAKMKGGIGLRQNIIVFNRY